MSRKLTPRQAQEIVSLHENGARKQELARLYRVSRSTIRAVLRGERYPETIRPDLTRKSCT